MSQQRLQKVLAACGVGSRRSCEELITQGRVEVDGEVVTKLGTQVDPDVQRIVCDGEPVRMPRQLWYLLNKPRGVICSQRGDPERPRAVDFAPPEAAGERLFTIGRLDVDSEGAILLTNDGELCHLVTHPRFEIPKTYRVEIDGHPDRETLAKMRRGVWLAEGRTGNLDIHILGRRGTRTVLEVRLNEGMKREIRRVCARFGHPVRRLQRVAIGPVRLARLPVGQIRSLTEDEVAALRDSAKAVIRLGSPRGAHGNRARSRGHLASHGPSGGPRGAKRAPGGGRSSPGSGPGRGGRATGRGRRTP